MPLEVGFLSKKPKINNIVHHYKENLNQHVNSTLNHLNVNTTSSKPSINQEVSSVSNCSRIPEVDQQNLFPTQESNQRTVTEDLNLALDQDLIIIQNHQENLLLTKGI